MEQLAALIAQSQAHWVAPVVAATLGTNEPASVAKKLVDAVAAALGQPVVAARFYEPGVGVVVGLEVAGGRVVVAKVHRAAFVSRERLLAIARLQADLAAAGVPAPMPLAGPIAVGNGWLSVEEHLPGHTADGYDPIVRRSMATALWAFVNSASAHADNSSLGMWLGEPVLDDLWPEPHDLRFDFPGTTAGAEWIDGAARAARSALASTILPHVVGHLDWRVQNLAFDGADIAAIFDWDSVGLVPEAALVGSTSAIHPVDWRRDLPDPLPRLEQIDSFVADYEVARGASFDDHERSILAAGQRWVVSYGARCQHSDHMLGLFPDVDHSRGWPRLLRELIRR